MRYQLESRSENRTTFLAYSVVTTTTPSNSLVLPAQSVVSSYNFGLCGSQLPSMQWSYSLPTFYSALRKLLSYKRPTLENVVHHLLWLCGDGGGSIRDIERVYTALNDSLAHTNDNSTLKDLLFEKRVLLLEDRKTLVAPKSVFAYVFLFHNFTQTYKLTFYFGYLSENVSPYAIDRGDLVSFFAQSLISLPLSVLHVKRLT